MSEELEGETDEVYYFFWPLDLNESGELSFWLKGIPRLEEDLVAIIFLSLTNGIF